MNRSELTRVPLRIKSSTLRLSVEQRQTGARQEQFRSCFLVKTAQLNLLKFHLRATNGVSDATNVGP
jgi:hypothetical protein